MNLNRKIRVQLRNKEEETEIMTNRGGQEKTEKETLEYLLRRMLQQYCYSVKLDKCSPSSGKTVTQRKRESERVRKSRNTALIPLTSCLYSDVTHTREVTMPLLSTSLNSFIFCLITPYAKSHSSELYLKRLQKFCYDTDSNTDILHSV